MHKNTINLMKLIRYPDAFLPIALLAACLLGKEYSALLLFLCAFSGRLCALASANGLRIAFARQPSMRYVQGSALTALCLQPAGGLICGLMSRFVFHLNVPVVFFVSGILLNIEHVFYEYICATGDRDSAMQCRLLTSVMALLSIMLSSPPTSGMSLPSDFEPLWLIAPTCVSVLVALLISRVMGGSFRPRMNDELFRVAPLALLQTALYPALALAGLWLMRPHVYTAAPLFAGLALYELFRTPFRRAPIESGPMNRALLLCCAVASACAVVYYFAFSGMSDPRLPLSCAAIVLASVCAFALYGNVDRREDDAP